MRIRKKGIHSRAGQTKTTTGVSGHTENASVVIMIMLARGLRALDAFTHVT